MAKLSTTTYCLHPTCSVIGLKVLLEPSLCSLNTFLSLSTRLRRLTLTLTLTPKRGGKKIQLYGEKYVVYIYLNIRVVHLVLDMVSLTN